MIDVEFGPELVVVYTNSGAVRVRFSTLERLIDARNVLSRAVTQAENHQAYLERDQEQYPAGGVR